VLAVLGQWQRGAQAVQRNSRCARICDSTCCGNESNSDMQSIPGFLQRQRDRNFT
jgi:hypothetical protein